MQNPPTRSFSRRALIGVLAVIILSVAVVYMILMPRVVPGQNPLTDVHNIETLQIQFNQDVGKTRLVLLVSPT